MLRTTEKAVLITACVAGIALAFLLWNPYAQVTTLSLEYVRGQAVKWARCIEERTPFTLDVPALVSQETVTIRVELPNEQPLIVTATKSKLRIPCPEASGGVLVYGPPTTWSAERKAKVYQEEGFVVVELVPRVQITTSSESGARVYIVRVELFRIDLSQIEARKTIGPKGVQELPYARGLRLLRDEQGLPQQRACGPVLCGQGRWCEGRGCLRAVELTHISGLSCENT